MDAICIDLPRQFHIVVDDEDRPELAYQRPQRSGLPDAQRGIGQLVAVLHDMRAALQRLAHLAQQLRRIRLVRRDGVQAANISSRIAKRFNSSHFTLSSIL